MEFKTNRKIAYARIRKIKHNEEKKKDEITIKLFNTNSEVRAHIITSNFISANDLNAFNSVKDVLENSITSEKFRLSQWKNAYLSNRKLGDEFRYVFDRKYRKRFTGNSLDKPQLIIKRLKIRETSFEEEIVKLGDNYPSLRNNISGEHMQMELDYNLIEA